MAVGALSILISVHTRRERESGDAGLREGQDETAVCKAQREASGEGTPSG